MVSRTQVQWVQSLKQKKFRQRYGMFVAAGDKVVRELLLSSLTIERIFALESWLEQHRELLRDVEECCQPVSESELKKLSFQEMPNAVLAVVIIPAEPARLPKEGWILALDGIRDPGNMGTLLRTADWFGVAGIYASPDCADRYNPKVVQSAMGSLFRVPCITAELLPVLSGDQRPVYGADSRGQDLRELIFTERGILVIGSESHGLSSQLEEVLKHRCKITGRGDAESLNASVAAGIILAKAMGFI